MNIPQTMQFVALYRDAECLWKINSEIYKDRNARDEALKHICNEMGINGFGIREVAQKIKNIRSAYYQEIKKINNSKKSGASTDDIYQPKVPWFTIVHSFLKQNSAMNATVSSPCDSQVQSNNTLKTPEDEDSCGQNYPIEGNSANQNVSGEIFKLPSDSRQATSSKKRRLQDRYVPPSYIGETIEKLDGIQINLLGETEFDIWCQSLAKQLNNMETLRALTLQMQIQSLVSKERINYEIQKSRNSSKNRPSTDSSVYQVPPVWHFNELQQPPISTGNFQSGSSSTTVQPNHEEDSWDSCLSVCSPSSDSL